VADQNLRIPGPTPLPDAVREAGRAQMINHRGPEFQDLLVRTSAAMRPWFGTQQDVLILTSSGTGGLEAAVVSVLSPGDPVLAVSIGNFGERLARIADVYGADVTQLDVEWGQAADVDSVRESVRAMVTEGRSPRAVLMTLNETSTGVTNPVAALAEAVRSAAPEALLIVDGVSAIGAMPFEMDAWGLDVVVTGSQKAWMIPPGLAMVAASERAWAAAATASMPRFYLDLVRHRDVLPKGQTPWTPAVGLVIQLERALQLMDAEGQEAIFARHAACAAASRAGLRALGFQLFADQAHASASVTSAHLPEGVEWSALSGELRARGLVLAGGQGKLKGRVFRIGHLGWVSVEDIVRALEVLEEGATAIGLFVPRGVAAREARSAAAETGLATAASGGRA
jgi:aspartate aminotransferase-like enzyme